MIANTTKGNNIGRAVDYITDEKKAEWYQERNVGRNDRDIIKKDMNFTAGKSSRVEKPVYHVSVSWHKHEHPSKEQKLAVADGLLKHLDLNDHQAVIASHVDRDHPHIHVVINRVHPDTGKVWEPYLYRENKDGKMVQNKNSYERIEEYLRTTEKEMGFEVDPGKHAGEWDKEFDGKAPEIWEIKHQAKSERIARGIGIEDVDLRPVKERAQVLKNELYRATSFQEFDKVLARNGLWITADGQGASITDGNYKVKASSVSRGLSGPKLEARFGESLKAYCKAREDQVDLQQAKEQFDYWGNLYEKEIYDKASSLSSRSESVTSARLRELIKYDSQITAVQSDLQDGFTQAFTNGKEAYHLLNEHIKANGYDESVSELIANPQAFGEVKDHGAVVDIGNALRTLEHIRGQYSNSFQRMSKTERAEQMKVLNKSLQKWQALRANLSRPARSKVRETEGGRALEGTASEIIALSRIAGKAAKNPGQTSMQAGMKTLQKVTTAMDSEGGQVAGRLLQNASRHISLATQMLVNPSKGTLKIVKNIIQSSTRLISQAGREAGRGR